MIPVTAAVCVNRVLCAACGSWDSPRSHPLILSMGACILAAALLCAAAAAWWRLKTPARLFALPAVLLAALLWVCTGNPLAHMAWLLGCIQPDWGAILLFVVAPTLAGRWQRWLCCDATACATAGLVRPRPRRRAHCCARQPAPTPAWALAQPAVHPNGARPALLAL